jgi:hypothetical protein
MCFDLRSLFVSPIVDIVQLAHHQKNGVIMTSTIPAPSETETSLLALNAYELASMADCGIPRNSISDGADFLGSIRNSFLESFKDGTLDVDDLFLIVDENIPVWYSSLWASFVDLEGYSEEVSEAGTHDMNGLASWALAEIGNRLVSALVGYIEE